ncbi:DctP family TRAP transporter solute-binding subunit [Pseudovibrio exalbescens]|uniref:C4-dicarboxylate ABC transporter substrate-binding protein n=1 Tax=Pseudovibrio exalbescens TaxID=197461 RepID=A0A1U7JC17_9HYPH|nr:DctP family TRAP transporter solute-binding subunit [Pseudovibrio exalbescens]OKL42300.1 C4-dicarboxylate ABC transporter substrate-binding protein [Pseudovibrio exalbescens]
MRSMRSLIAAACMTALVGGGASAAEMRIGHDAPPDAKGNVTHAYAAVLGSAVEAATNGDITVEIYPNNQLGNSEERLQQVRDGVIQGSVASVGSLTPVYPDLDILNLPFAFDNMAAVYKVYEGEFGKKLARSIEEKLGDVIVLGIADPGGFFALTNSKKPIQTLEDFKGLRIRTMTVPAHQRLIQALGAEAYPLAWSEVYTGLQTGVIDGQMNPVPTVYRTKLFEVQSNTSLIKHLYNPLFFLVNKQFFEGLTPEQQDILRAASMEAVVATRGLGRISEAQDTVQLMERMEVNTPAREEVERMREIAIAEMDKYFEETLSDNGKELLKEFKAAIAEANASVYLK